MSGSAEWDKCECCGKEGPVQRTYFYYDIDCECCSSNYKGYKVHFEFVRHCNDCVPKEPTTIKVDLKASKYLVQ